MTEPRLEKGKGDNKSVIRSSTAYRCGLGVVGPLHSPVI